MMAWEGDRLKPDTPPSSREPECNYQNKKDRGLFYIRLRRVLRSGPIKGIQSTLVTIKPGGDK